MTRPTLTVPGNPADWLPRLPTGECRCSGECHGGHTFSLGAPPALSWVPVDELPEVHSDVGNGADVAGIFSGPLRAGDVVTLDVEPSGCGRCDPWSSHLHGERGDIGETCVDLGCDQHSAGGPFATAKVAEVVWVESNRTWDGETFPALCRTADGEVFLRTGRGEHNPKLPGDWSSARFGVRLDSVEALT